MEYAVAGALVAVSLVAVYAALGDGVGASMGGICKIVKNDGQDD